MPPAPCRKTLSDRTLQAVTGFAPATGIEQDIVRFITWYRGYYGITP